MPAQSTTKPLEFEGRGRGLARLGVCPHRTAGKSSPGSAGVPPAPYSCKQPAIHGHSLAKRTEPAFTGFSSIVPGFVRAGRPRSQGGYSFLVPDPWQTPLDFPPTP